MQPNSGSLANQKCLNHHRQNHNQKEGPLLQNEDKLKIATSKDIVIEETQSISIIPIVNSKGEEHSKNDIKVVNEVSEIGDVRQQLNECVVSVQNKILDTLLVGLLINWWIFNRMQASSNYGLSSLQPNFIVMGRFGELGQRLECGDGAHFNNLQTIILDTAFVEKLKNHKPMPSVDKFAKVKFLSLPRWEQQFLGLRRGKCANRFVLAYAKPPGKYLDLFVDEEKD